jgi:hypothetical protein
LGFAARMAKDKLAVTSAVKERQGVGLEASYNPS